MASYIALKLKATTREILGSCFTPMIRLRLAHMSRWKRGGKEKWSEPNGSLSQAQTIEVRRRWQEAAREHDRVESRATKTSAENRRLDTRPRKASDHARLSNRETSSVTRRFTRVSRCLICLCATQMANFTAYNSSRRWHKKISKRRARHGLLLYSGRHSGRTARNL